MSIPENTTGTEQTDRRKLREEVLQKNVENLRPLKDKTTNKNIWLANPTVRLFLKSAASPTAEKRKLLKLKRKKG